MVISMLLLTAIVLPLSAAADRYPVIRKLVFNDIYFRQLQEDISFYHRAAASRKDLPPLMLYEYTAEAGDTVFSIAAAAGLSYESIATINGIYSSTEYLAGRKLLIPGQPGLFIPEKPVKDLDFIFHSWRMASFTDENEIGIYMPVSDSESELRNYYFIHGESFHSIERAYFLGILFSNPLPDGIVSSGYGMRKNPFSGHPTFHDGIDIAAPEGTPVYAAREGEVTDTGYNETFGNYILIEHSGGYSTFYGHLNKIFVELHYKVNSTMMIAEVGTTGRSTGPHLHFEIRRSGASRDPSVLTPGLK